MNDAQSTNRPRRSRHYRRPARATTIGGFLHELETVRGNSIATRNTRLAAIHSLFRYASLHAPEHADQISRVLAIQTKRTATTLVNFLDRAELDALLAAPDQSTWHGRRDHALLVVAVQTGLRVAELTNLTVHDAQLGVGAHVYCRGKGRKDRCTPLTTHTVGVLTHWLDTRHPANTDPLFPTRRGSPLSHDAVARLVAKHTATAAHTCPSLQTKHVTPHRPSRRCPGHPGPYAGGVPAPGDPPARRPDCCADLRVAAPTFPHRRAGGDRAPDGRARCGVRLEDGGTDHGRRRTAGAAPTRTSSSSGRQR